MSLIVTTYVPDGIIIAGESRFTLNLMDKDEEKQITYHTSIPVSDNTNKVF